MNLSFIGLFGNDDPSLDAVRRAHERLAEERQQRDFDRRRASWNWSPTTQAVKDAEAEAVAIEEAARRGEAVEEIERQQRAEREAAQEAERSALEEHRRVREERETTARREAEARFLERMARVIARMDEEDAEWDAWAGAHNREQREVDRIAGLVRQEWDRQGVEKYGSVAAWFNSRERRSEVDSPHQLAWRLLRRKQKDEGERMKATVEEFAPPRPTEPAPTPASPSARREDHDFRKWDWRSRKPQVPAVDVPEEPDRDEA